MSLNKPARCSSQPRDRISSTTVDAVGTTVDTSFNISSAILMASFASITADEAKSLTQKIIDSVQRDDQQAKEWTELFVKLGEVVAHSDEAVRTLIAQAGISVILRQILIRLLEIMDFRRKKNSATAVLARRNSQRVVPQKRNSETTQSTSPITTKLALPPEGDDHTAKTTLVESETTMAHHSKRIKVADEELRALGEPSISSVLAAAHTADETTDSQTAETGNDEKKVNADNDEDEDGDDVGPYFAFHQDDIHRAIRILAYLSKHPKIREIILTFDSELVQEIHQLTNALEHPEAIVYWAGVVMRNYSRPNDEGLRRCAAPYCGKLESRPKEFNRCPRCRIASFCTKEHFKLGKARDHPNWCVTKSTIPE